MNRPDPARPWATFAGLVAWALLTGALGPGWPEAFLLLAAFVIVPLGARLASETRPSRLLARVLVYQPAASLLLAASLSSPAGLAAAALALPWLGVTGLVTAEGLLRFRDGPRRLPDRVEAAGLVYLGVGGLWMMASRYGYRPLGFPDLIVVMTAVHFHYAGFALPILASRVARTKPGILGRIAAIGAASGVPLVALGITDSHLALGLGPPRLLELIATLVMTGSTVLVGLLQVAVARGDRSGAVSRALLLASGLSVLLPMGLAVTYAAGGFAHVVWVEIPLMFRLHGALNALGFSFLGLLGWTFAVAEPAPQIHSTVMIR